MTTQANTNRLKQIVGMKYGKTIVLGTLIILITLMMVGVYLLSSNVSPKTNVSESKVEKPTKNTAETSQAVNADDPVDSKKEDKFYGDINSKFMEPKDNIECSNRFPPNGFKKIFKKNWIDNNIAKSEVKFENKTDLPIWIKLIHPTANFPIFGILVYPMETVVERINIGLYGVEFSKGVKWCNAMTGITDSKTLILSKNLALGRINAAAMRVSLDPHGAPEAILYEIQRIATSEAGVTLLEKN